MSICVDELIDHGMRIKNRVILSCRMFSDQNNIQELCAFGSKHFALQVNWLGAVIHDEGVPCFALVALMRVKAISKGALEISNKRGSAIRAKLRARCEREKTKWL